MKAQKDNCNSIGHFSTQRFGEDLENVRESVGNSVKDAVKLIVESLSVYISKATLSKTYQDAANVQLEVTSIQSYAMRILKEQSAYNPNIFTISPCSFVPPRKQKAKKLLVCFVPNFIQTLSYFTPPLL